MIFTETPLKGAFIIEKEPFFDERGAFVRNWCKKDFTEHGLHAQFVQSNLSFNKKKGIIRGMHFQSPPYQEIKLVSCIKGEIFDVIIDLRPESETFKQWVSVVLSDKNQKMLYVPQGFAHGFQSLDDNTYVFYHVSEYYHPEFERGIRWNDPSFNIAWPILKDIVLSHKDSSFEEFK
ncbi:dTDP-4-dehydrorhamnose 3,5-epimerase [Bacillus salipaludis]|uniref:dTDP-4-dehydrorhamnose 3,5-epimerase n=1 Tax=Bacillus salipaludis TaxID=2547811 RepID=UPI003D2559E6